MAEQPIISQRWLQRFRWLWLIIALYGSIMTPFAIISAYRESIADHIMIVPMLLAITIRLAMIGWLFSLWLKFSPAKSETNDTASQQLIKNR